MKKITVLFIFSLFFCSVFSQELPTTIQAAYQSYQNKFPLEKIYLQTDRTLYEPGESIWFNAYLVNDKHLKSKESHIVLVELINPRGALVERLNVQKMGSASFKGNFRLQRDIVGGVYKIRAYTSWLRNFGTKHYFEKEITVQRVTTPRVLMKLKFEREAYSAGDQPTAKLELRRPNNQPLIDHEVKYVVSLAGKSYETKNARTDHEGKLNINFELPQNLTSKDGLINVIIQFEGGRESISRSIPIVLNKVAVNFFPEGGYLMYGMTNRVAFEALNEYGKPADIKAVVIDENNQVVADFESYYQGRGAFEFEPKQGKKYQVKMTKPAVQTFDLPRILKQGIGIRKVKQDEEKVSFYIHPSKSQTLHLIAEIRGKVYHRQTLHQAKSGIYDIKTADLPVGIMKLTVFDERLRPQTERLTFINNHRQIKVDISTDKKEYLPRERVRLSLEVTDETGKGVAGDFSLAVVEDKQHTFIDDKQDNILSYLLMSSELRGKVHQPNFYFDKKEKKAAQALDFVMLTNGWRQFNWREIIANQEDWQSKIKYPKDQYVLRGTVRLNSTPIENVKVYIEGDKENTIKTDKNGLFTFFLTKENLKKDKIKITTKYKGLKSTQIAVKNYFQYNIPVLNKSKEESVNIQALKGNKQIVKAKKMEKREIPIAIVNVPTAPRSTINNALAGSLVSIQAENIKEYNTAITVQSVSSMSEMVVVGYGTSTASDIGYSMDMNVNSWDVPSLVMSFGNYTRPYYGKKFYAPSYARTKTTRRNDFRKTLFWQPLLRTSNNGLASTTFYCSDESTTFRAIVEGIGDQGKVGRNEYTFASINPLNIEVKTPSKVTIGDEFTASVLMKNNTNAPISVNIKQLGNNANCFQFASNEATSVTIGANDFINQKVKLKAGNIVTSKYIYFSIETSNSFEYFHKRIDVEAKGFETGVTISGDEELKQSYSFEIDEFEQGSLKGSIQAYPSIVGELMDGVSSMVREPHGCFEQVSSSNYPNIYVLRFMDEMKVRDKETRNKAKAYLAKAYVKLAGYECNGGGFDWYGENPADERLTAYGLLEFMDMKKVYSRVSQEMIDRTAIWLSNKRDGKGGWKKGSYYGYRNSTALHNTYVTYAMSVYGAINVDAEVDQATQKAIETKDWYCLPLAVMSNWHTGKKDRAREALDILVEEVNNKGIVNINTKSTLTYSYGRSRNVETWAVIAQAIIQQKREDLLPMVNDLLNNISQNKYGKGYFGSTQATIQALKAFTDYAQWIEQVRRKGQLNIYVNNKFKAQQKYTEDSKKLATVDISSLLKMGKNTVRIEFAGTDTPIPFTIKVDWKTLKPNSSPDCKVKLETIFAKNTAKTGETLRLTAKVVNIENEDVFNPIALIGIPAGMSLQPWQLKELKEKNKFAYYEIQDNYLVVYFRHLKANETKVINLDLKAEFSGKYQAGASSAYLYYGAEDKNWQKGVEVVIN